jgi:hypothetical protein
MNIHIYFDNICSRYFNFKNYKKVGFIKII